MQPTAAMPLPANEDIRAATKRATDWLLDCAAPLWSSCGRTAGGLFAERITLAGVPDATYFRTFVQARHIYSFCVIGELGWRGPWCDLVNQSVDTLLSTARRADGFFVHRLDAGGSHLDPRADLYDQAFVLFALGTAGATLERSDCFDAAESLLDRIEQNWGHPAGGFAEGEIVDQRVRRQNPHMHLFEAAQALHRGSGRERFGELGHRIADICHRHFIDQESGALLEYFDDALKPAAGLDGRRVEPGHCFEWAWLFERLAQQGWSEGLQISDHLTSFVRRTGIDPVRGVAVNEVLTDGSVHDAKARLWPQTERIKAAVIRFNRTGDQAERLEVIDACEGLELYYDVPVLGLWRDKLRADGTWVDELAPGSSLYHISCAIAELHTVAAA